MNRYEFKGGFKKGLQSQAFKQAKADMMYDDVSIVQWDYFGITIERRVIITEEMLGIEI